MLFSSITFLYYFLPIIIVLYFLVPAQLKNLVLLIASLIFYGWGEPQYLSIMLISIAANYVLGLLIEKSPNPILKKLWLTASAVFSLSLLGYFKYADFFIENMNKLTGSSFPLFKIALPIGISFYTFQLLSYTIDVYHGDTPAQRNIIHLAAYVSLFPQLIAGPIVRYSDIAAQLKERNHTIPMISEGIRRFIFGLGKKVLLANALGKLCDIFHNSNDLSVLFYWIYAVSFTLQIYFDFSGYSDMAIGLGKMFGFDFLKNFNYPYISSSITEFWRRWHISLGSWFRDYVYIPLGGNRVSRPRWFFNIFVVWMLTGLWHGAAWNFIVWGLFFAIFLVIEKIWLLDQFKLWKDKKLLRIFPHIYVLFIVTISFVIFNAGDIAHAYTDLSGMFGLQAELPLLSTESIYYFRSYLVIFTFAAIGATPLLQKLIAKLRSYHAGKFLTDLIEPFFLAAILLFVTAYLVDGSFNPFLYFRF